MPTFAELANTLNQTRFQKAILSHLVEYLDTEFMPVLDAAPKKVLLTEEKLKVPDDAVDQIIQGINNWIKACQKQEQQLLAMSFTEEKQPEPPAQEVTPTSEATT